MIDYKSLYQVDPSYWEELYLIQTELLKLQKFVFENNKRVAILFEGRDAAGKGSAINRFTQFLNPNSYRIVALGKPSAVEKGQWYFQRYISQLPNEGEMVFFDRSWYNRAVVEPVMGFCTKKKYFLFMKQVVAFEKMLVEDGMILIKFWFSIKMDEQQDRIQGRLENPLKKWKISPVDLAAREKWDDFTHYKESMFRQTNTPEAPWNIIKGTNREEGRIMAMKHVLSTIEYGGNIFDSNNSKQI